MCFDIKVLQETALIRASRKNDPEFMFTIKKELEAFNKINFHHVSGFSHPGIFVYTNENSYHPKLQHWGLIPFWAKDEKSAFSIQNKTLNARAESVFQKPSFRDPAKNKRCLIFIDGFYEHHHYKGKTYPYYIYPENKTTFCLAGIWDEWINKDSGEIYRGFSIITTKAKGLMEKIHNNPKLQEARMPLVLDEKEENDWLTTIKNQEQLAEFIQSKKEIHIQAHTVHKLRGKNALGNVPEANKACVYPELKKD